MNYTQVVQRECGAHRNVWVPVVDATMAVCVTTRLVPVSVLRASVETAANEVISSFQTLPGCRRILLTIRICITKDDIPRFLWKCFSHAFQYNQYDTND